MKLFKMQVLLTVVVLCIFGSARANWVRLDFPGATSTYAYDIDAGRIVGYYSFPRGGLGGGDPPGNNGFVYEGGSWTELCKYLVGAWDVRL